MKKIILSVFYLFSLHFSFGQISTMFTDDFSDSIHFNKIGIIADGAVNSNAVTNEFTSKFYRGGYISVDLKDRVLARMKNKNRLGADINYSLYGTFKLDSLFHKKNLSFFIALKNREHFDVRFSKDLYKVGFYGNAIYAGKTASFNDFNLNLIRYQQVQVGIFSSKLDSAARWGIGLSFLKGEQYLSVLAPKAQLFTSEDGQYIDFNTDFYIGQSDTLKKGLGAFNGYGSSVDIYFEAPFKTKFGDSKLKVAVSDIGFIKFNKQSITAHQDSLFHYSGFTINSIYDLQDSTLKNLNQDSIIAGVVPMKKQSISVTLPAVLNVSFETHFNNYFHLQEGVRYVYNANYSLMAYIKGNFYFTQHFMLSATFAYGGYGTYNYGLSVNAKLGKSILLFAGSNNIEGIVVPKKTTGLSAFAGISCSF